MNERIRELESQCWETQQLTSDANSWHTSFNSRKFAELIVRECVEQCNVNFVGTVGTHSSAHNRGVKKCIDNIKDHFGVIE